VESSWLIEDRLGPAAEAAFLRSVYSAEFNRADLNDSDWQRCVELVETYADLGSDWSTPASSPLPNASGSPPSLRSTAETSP
jgi:hypothetical protein